MVRGFPARARSTAAPARESRAARSRPVANRRSCARRCQSWDQRTEDRQGWKKQELWGSSWFICRPSICRLSAVYLSVIGIGDADLRQNVALKPFHAFGLAIPLVIVSQKMEKAMDRQMGKMVRQRLALLGGFAGDRFIGNGDVPEQCRPDRIEASRRG